MVLHAISDISVVSSLGGCDEGDYPVRLCMILNINSLLKAGNIITKLTERALFRDDKGSECGTSIFTNQILMKGTKHQNCT